VPDSARIDNPAGRDLVPAGWEAGGEIVKHAPSQPMFANLMNRAARHRAPVAAHGGAAAYRARSAEARANVQVERFFNGIITRPACRVTLVHRRYPDGTSAIEDAHVHRCGGVAVRR
jgi:hypothetical protein